MNVSSATRFFKRLGSLTKQEKAHKTATDCIQDNMSTETYTLLKTHLLDLSRGVQ